MRRRTLEEKLEAIRLVEEGNSARSVSDRLHIGHHQIYEWLYIYKEKGASGLENKRICRKNQFSFEKKCEIIREYQKSELTLPEISSKHGISASTLVGWLSKFNKGGMDALASKQPLPREQSKSIMKRVPKEECEKENERLRKENERLRAENLLLKKVKALVEERESRNRRMIMKSELLYAKKYTSMDCFITDLKEYMVYYNNERIKLRLNGMSPVLYRKAFEQAHSY